jgi:fatty acid desaturase
MLWPGQFKITMVDEKEAAADKAATIPAVIVALIIWLCGVRGAWLAIVPLCVYGVWRLGMKMRICRLPDEYVGGHCDDKK